MRALRRLEGRGQGGEGKVGRRAALLFDHVLVDHGGDDGQGDNVPGHGQNLCDLFVLGRRSVSSHLGPGATLQAPLVGRSAWPLLEDPAAGRRGSQADIQVKPCLSKNVRPLTRASLQ